MHFGRIILAVLTCLGTMWVATFAIALSADMDYQRARWDPIHFKPAIDFARDEQCLSCHQAILSRNVLEQSPAGVKASEALAWYQTLDTYAGAQQTFHQRHIATPLAQDLMRLRCNFCHQGHDPREEAPGSSATAAAAGSNAGFTLRKVVNPEQNCLLCHGSFNYEVMEGVEGPWHQVRQDF